MCPASYSSVSICQSASGCGPGRMPAMSDRRRRAGSGLRRFFRPAAALSSVGDPGLFSLSFGNSGARALCHRSVLRRRIRRG